MICLAKPHNGIQNSYALSQLIIAALIAERIGVSTAYSKVIRFYPHSLF